jgi:hypothetical protein
VDYEIFHDVLAPAILSWRAQYIQTQEQAETEIRAKEQQRQAEEQARAQEQARAAGRLRRLVRTLMIVSLLTVLLAVGAGLLAILAHRESQKAVQQASLAEEAREGEARQRIKAEQALNAAQSALAAAQLARESTPDQPTPAGVTDLLDKAQTDYAAAQRVREAPPTKQASPSAAAGLPTRIYLQIQDTGQLPRAQQIEKALEDQKFIVPGIETLKTGPTTGAEVRFFREGESGEANRIADILRSLQVQGAQAKYIPGYEGSTKIRPRHFEIWFAPDAFK